MTTVVVLSSIIREFWFSDGDVVLECPWNGRPVYYRVHKSILSQNSFLFRYTLKLEALASRSLKKANGAPVVPLPEPSVEITRLLRCLYNGMNEGTFQDPQRPIVPYDGLLRICNKYQIVPLRECILTRLKTEWPATLHGWDAREAYITKLRKEHIEAGPSGRVHDMYLDDRLPEPVMTIKLACANGLAELFPAALNDLARRDLCADWDAFHMVATRDLPENQKLLAKGVRSARWGMLAARHLLSLATFKERQLKCVQGLISRLSEDPLPHPSRATTCCIVSKR